MKNRTYVVIGTIIFVFTLAACGQSTGGPQAWLDRPLDNSTLPLASLIIQAHASDSNGIASFEFYADDTLLSSVSGSGGRLSDASIEWTPTEPGKYTIKAMAIDNDGNAGSFATSSITIEGGTSQYTPTADVLLLEETATAEAFPAETTFARITHVECADGLAVNVDVSIGNPQGITSFTVFSTLVQGETVETFSSPLPQMIEKRVRLVESVVDNVDRAHQIGLKVELPDQVDPIFVYANEPQDRCPGHYLPFAGPSEPIAPLGTAKQNTNCHSGPAMEYNVVTTILEGYTTVIEGRTADSSWLMIDPGVGGMTCWVPATAVDVTGEISGVAVVPAAPLPITNTPLPITDTPIPTYTPTIHPTVAPSLVPDTTPPHFAFAGVDPDEILTEGGGCSSYPRTSTVTAAVSDASGINSVVAYWYIGGESGQVTLTYNGDLYESVIGPVNTTGTMTVEITAQDTAGNTADSSTLYIDVQNCIG